MYLLEGRESAVVWICWIHPASSTQDVPVGVGLQGLQGLRPIQEQPLAPPHLHAYAQADAGHSIYMAGVALSPEHCLQMAGSSLIRKTHQCTVSIKRRHSQGTGKSGADGDCWWKHMTKEQTCVRMDMWLS